MLGLVKIKIGKLETGEIGKGIPAEVSAFCCREVKTGKLETRKLDMLFCEVSGITRRSKNWEIGNWKLDSSFSEVFMTGQPPPRFWEQHVLIPAVWRLAAQGVQPENGVRELETGNWELEMYFPPTFQERGGMLFEAVSFLFVWIVWNCILGPC